MRSALFGLLFAACAQASAQQGMLVSPLPDLDSRRILDITRQVLAARGWTEVREERSMIAARKNGAVMRIFLDEDGLRYGDQPQRAHVRRQRNHEVSSDVPQTEIDALRTDLAVAFASAQPASASQSRKATGQVLVGVPIGVDPRDVMTAARQAFLGRHWNVKDDADGAFIADIRGAQDSAKLRVFVADGALRFIDRSTDRKGGKAQVPERWLNNIRADLRMPFPREATVGTGDSAARMRRLKALLDDGLITQSEYDAKRAEILKGL